MELKYMIDSICVDKEKHEYQSIGFWVIAEGKIEMHYLPIVSEEIRARKAYCFGVRNMIGDNDLPDDFLEHHQRQRSSYQGEFSQIVTTTRFNSVEALKKKLFSDMKII